MYIAEHPFMDALLGDWALRTEDPWEANLFVIPAYTFYYTGSAGRDGAGAGACVHGACVHIRST